MTKRALHTPFEGSGVLTRQFILSEEFTVAYIASIVFVTLGLPALGACTHLLINGVVDAGCLFAIIGIGVTGLCSWKLTTALNQAHHRYHPRNN